MSEKGFIKLDRKLLDWGWKDNPNIVALWIEILLQANISDREWHGTKFETGTFPTSLAKLSINTGLSIQQVRTCLDKLKSTNEITVQATNKGMKISVVKWAEYQCSPVKSNMPNNTVATDKQQEANTQATTLKERKNERKKEYSIKGFTPPTLDEVREYCEERQNRVDYRKFYNYYDVAGWKDSKGNPVRNWKQKMIANWEKDKPRKMADDVPSVYKSMSNVRLSNAEIEKLLELREERNVSQ